MISKTITYLCPRCESPRLEKNGRSKNGKQKYHCQDCNAYGTLNPSVQFWGVRRIQSAARQ